MADIDFTKLQYVEGSDDPPYSAANLNRLENAVDKIVHKANRGSAVLVADKLADSTIYEYFTYASTVIPSGEVWAVSGCPNTSGVIHL